MNTDIRRLLRWLRRAQPPAGPLFRALASGFVASITNVALLVGAVALLVESATRPGLAAVLGVLILIELLAFLRSPIRFNERIRSHQLGFRAVSRWRRWLVETIGRWNFTRWRSYAAGDLLERSLRDTDELQDLWLRCVIPLVGTLATLLVADLVIGFLPARGSWWSFGALLALFQILAVAGLLANVEPLIRAERSLRTSRAFYQSTLVELSSVGPELLLLGRDDYVAQRSRLARESLHRGEEVLWRRRRLSSGVALVTTLAALVTLAGDHPHSSAIWFVVAALLSFSTFDALSTIRGALDTAVAISGAAERLEDLDAPVPEADHPWPQDVTMRATHLQLTEGEKVLLNDGTIELRPGQRLGLSGPSGTGKSTLLRALAALDTVESGAVTIGTTTLGEIEESQLRRHLAYVASEPGLTTGFVHDVVLLGRSGTREIAQDLAALGLVVDVTTKWGELSRGERQRVAILRALVTGPDIYLLDEPTSALGVEETRAVLDLLSSTGASVLVASHDQQVLAWCDTVVQLVDGVIEPL
jgi:ABC-type transport system involved in cytochrome bd biosynthesis fused ATPase/permease subunit